MSLELVHQLPGRIRLRAGALKYLASVRGELLESFKTHHYLDSVEYNHITGSILVAFDEEELSPEEVVEIVETQIAVFSIVAYQAEREASSLLTVNERRLQEESVRDIFHRVAISGVSLLLFSFFPGLRGLGRGSWWKRLLGPPTAVSVGLSIPIFRSGLNSLVKTKRPNADTLTSSAILTALITGRPFSALITILLADIAEMMTAYTMENTRRAIGDMLSVGHEAVFVLTPEGQLVLKPVEELVVGDVVNIQTGDKISVDGAITEGDVYIDESPITGEFFPVKKGLDDQVYAGTIVKSGQMRVRVNRVGDDTTVARIVYMVESAVTKKAQIQTFADRFSAQLIPLNFALALIIYALTRNVNRALSMMIIDYSCGVRLSTATALSACIHNAARNGVLIKGGNYVEAMAEADSLVLDKTGTITEGKPKVMSIYTTNDVTEKELLQFAAAAEEDSSHPLAHAILDRTKRLGYRIPKHGMIEVSVGRGVCTTVETAANDGETTILVPSKVFIGNRKYMKDHQVELAALSREIANLEQRGESIVYVAKNQELIGVIGIHDALKKNMKKALNRLRNLGFDDVRLLTGDISFQAEKVAARMHMDEYLAELMPEDKVRTVLNMQGNGSKVITIGDGINDAPALAYSDVGIAIGHTRTDVAIESSNVTIINDDPLLIPFVIQLSKETMATVSTNFKLVVAVNTLGIILSAMGWLPVVWGSVLHNSSTILVVLNSGRLLFKDFRRGVNA